LERLAVAVLNELECIDIEGTDRDVRAKGFIKWMTEFEFCMLMEMALELFGVTDRLSKVMQKATMSAMDGMHAAHLVTATISGWRNAEHFELLWGKAELLREKLSADMPFLPPQRKRTKRYESGTAADHAFLSPQEMFRAVYFNVLDLAHGAIKNRVSGKGFEILKSVENVVVNGMQGQWNISEDEALLLKNLAAHFMDDVNMVEVVNELHIISNSASAKVVKNMIDCITLFRNFSDSEKELFPHLFKLCKLYLVLPCSTASAERTFSQVRRVKSYLRTSMKQERLNHLMVLRAYKEQLDTIPAKEILRDFIFANEQRLRTFALP
jgi:hypothetical protein